MSTYTQKLLASAKKAGSVSDLEENLRRAVELLGGSAYQDGVPVSYPGSVSIESLKLGAGLGNEWKAEPYSYLVVQAPLNAVEGSSPAEHWRSSGVGGAGVYIPDIGTPPGKAVLVAAYLYYSSAPGAVTATVTVSSAAGDLATFNVTGLAVPVVIYGGGSNAATYATGTVLDPAGTLDDSSSGNGFTVTVSSLTVAGGTTTDEIEGLTVQLVFKVQHVA